MFHSINILSRKTSSPQNLIGSIRQLTKHVNPASNEDRVIELLNRFQNEPMLKCIPVIKRGRLCGLINRHRFMEDHMVGKFGFGHSLNYYKTIDSVLEPTYLHVDERTSIEDVAKLIQSRSHEQLYDDICVTSENCYLGVVSVGELLNGIMENNLILAIGANPLSGLPGNDFIQRKIREILTTHDNYDICYIDIDFFKPYNDKYGFAKGDEVIKLVAELMIEELETHPDSSSGFAGHIGGDDFILISRPKQSETVCQSIIKRFEDNLFRFHEPEECSLGHYQSTNRKGDKESFPLLSLSIAIINTGLRNTTYAELSSLTSELKKKAKKTAGSAICRNRRSK